MVEAYTSLVIDLGKDPGVASSMKLAVNFEANGVNRVVDYGNEGRDYHNVGRDAHLLRDEVAQ